MRVLFDARAWRSQTDGLSNYVHHLVAEMIRQDQTVDYVLIVNQALHEAWSREGLFAHRHVHPILSSIPFMGLEQQLRVPLLVRRLPSAAVYHYPHFDLPLLAHPAAVVTIHDLNPCALPDYFDSFRLLKRTYAAWATRWAATKAMRVLVVSEATKRTLLSFVPSLKSEQVVVTHHGITGNIGAAIPSEAQAGRFRRRYRLADHRFILYVGTDRPHKNLPRLIQAYARLRADGACRQKLLLVGGFTHHAQLERLAVSLGVGDDVVLTGHVASEELPLAYQAADVFALCSLSEGFGMPLLEAMAAGVPVVTSSRGSMAEVAGDAAVLVDPESVEAMAHGLGQVLGSPRLQESLIEHGRRRLDTFSWRSAARRTLEVYRDVWERRLSEAAPIEAPQS
jgi:alpha-1,3-rhamnosyl/mannosyltransferase